LERTTQHGKNILSSMGRRLNVGPQLDFEMLCANPQGVQLIRTFIKHLQTVAFCARLKDTNRYTFTATGNKRVIGEEAVKKASALFEEIILSSGS
jgi:hypothetical protein